MCIKGDFMRVDQVAPLADQQEVVQFSLNLVHGFNQVFKEHNIRIRVPKARKKRKRKRKRRLLKVKKELVRIVRQERKKEKKKKKKKKGKEKEKGEKKGKTHIMNSESAISAALEKRQSYLGMW